METMDRATAAGDGRHADPERSKTPFGQLTATVLRLAIFTAQLTAKLPPSWIPAFIGAAALGRWATMIVSTAFSIAAIRLILHIIDMGNAIRAGQPIKTHPRLSVQSWIWLTSGVAVRAAATGYAVSLWLNPTAGTVAGMVVWLWSLCYRFLLFDKTGAPSKLAEKMSRPISRP